MRDFTSQQYKQLLSRLTEESYLFLTFKEYVQTKDISRLIILRHDVEKYYPNALKLAQIQSDFGIQGTFYFRLLRNHFQPKIIQEIASKGHEIGYHYDDLAECNGNIDKAYDRFQRNLELLRKIAPVETISMDGSPLSKFDNRAIWQKYDYRKLGIIAEPYFDIDFNKLYYITDTGRRWDGHLYNVRDKATKENPVTNPDFLNRRYHTTQDIINAVNQGTFPKQAMLNFHPQRWNDKPLPWLKELVWQNVKNQGKRVLITLRK